MICSLRGPVIGNKLFGIKNNSLITTQNDDHHILSKTHIFVWIKLRKCIKIKALYQFLPLLCSKGYFKLMQTKTSSRPQSSKYD